MVKAVAATRRTVNAIRRAHEEQIKANSKPSHIIFAGKSSNDGTQVGYIVGRDNGADPIYTTLYKGQFLAIDNGDETISVVDGSDRSSEYCGICYIGNAVFKVPVTTLTRGDIYLMLALRRRWI